MALKKKPKTTREKLNKLVDKRTKLRNKKKTLEDRKKEGKKTFLGKLKKKRVTKKLQKIKKKINDPNTPVGRMALDDLKNSKTKKNKLKNTTSPSPYARMKNKLKTMVKDYKSTKKNTKNTKNKTVKKTKQRDLSKPLSETPFLKIRRF